MVQNESDGMTECLPEKAAAQMPHIFRPYTLDPIAVHQLAEHRFNPVSEATQQRASMRPRLGRSLLEWNLQVKTALSQFRLEFRTPVVAVSQYSSLPSADQVRHDSRLVNGGGSDCEADDDSGPRHQRVYPKAIEGLTQQCIVTEVALSPEASASVCARELTGGKGETVHHFSKGSYSACLSICCHIISFTAHRLAACLTNVVRCIVPIAGNRCV